METEYTIITKFRNKEQFDILFAGLQKKKKTIFMKLLIIILQIYQLKHYIDMDTF